jgi:hypothetical protein
MVGFELRRRVKLAIIAAIIGFFIIPSGVFLAALSQESSAAHPELTNYDQMRSGLALYRMTGWGFCKVSPQDYQILLSSEGEIYCEVYVSDVETLDWNGSQVYVPAQSAVEQLAAIRNSHFYVSRFSPSIGITVDKQMLQQIAAVPSVYCIRIIPPVSPVA